MEFIKYPTISAVDAPALDDIVVVEEKFHGCQVSFYLDGRNGRIRYARRNGWANGYFYKCLETLPQYNEAVRRTYAAVVAKYPDTVSITVDGEFIGAHIQKAIFYVYAPVFVPFDVRINGRKQLLNDYYWLRKTFRECGFSLVPTCRFEGPWREFQTTDIETVESELSTTHYAEGLVVRGLDTGHRYKLKRAQFREDNWPENRAANLLLKQPELDGYDDADQLTALLIKDAQSDGIRFSRRTARTAVKKALRARAAEAAAAERLDDD